MGTRKQLLNVFFVLLISTILMQVDPFGFQAATYEVAKNTLYNAYAVSYPPRFREKIVVVVVEDEDLKALDEYSPPRHLLHQEILSAIKNHRPKAVMVDVAFNGTRPEPTLPTLLQVINDYAEAEIPLYIAAAGQSIGAVSEIRPQIAEAADEGKVRLVSIEVGENENVPVVPDSSGYRPASLAIHDDLCALGWPKNCEPLADVASAPIEVVWGARPSNYNCADNEETCGRIGSSSFARFLQILAHNLLGNLLDLQDILTLKVPYHSSVPVYELMDGRLYDFLHPVIQDSVVFYGSALSFSSDVGFSPVHEEPEGVYKLAMAYDNLITFGEGYVRVVLPFAMPQWLHSQILLILFCLIFLAVRLALTRSGVDKTGRMTQLTLGITLSLFLPLFVAVIEFVAFNFSPTNWLGIFGALTISLIVWSNETQSKAETAIAKVMAPMRGWLIKHD